VYDIQACSPKQGWGTPASREIETWRESERREREQIVYRETEYGEREREGERECAV